MARFEVDNVDGLMLSMKEVAELPAEVITEMVEKGADVAVEAQKRKIQELDLIDSGDLQRSIKAIIKRTGRAPYALVYPSGTHHTQNSNRHHGRQRSGDVRNAEVGFVQEFGAPDRKIKAKQWMRLANEDAADALTQAELAVYDRWLQQKNL